MFKALKLVGFFNLGISSWTVQNSIFNSEEAFNFRWISEN